MRIVSGNHKGRRLNPPKNLPVRPTTDFAKEALFNILNNKYRFSRLTVIDLFSGTGNISFEFASRGAASITSVDAHAACTRYIDKVTVELDLPISVIKSDVFKFLSATAITADIIFADPPYDFQSDSLERLCQIAFERGLIKEDGMLILEHSKRMDLSSFPNFSESRKYGNSVFSFFLPKLER